jgi:cell division protein FtsA
MSLIAPRKSFSSDSGEAVRLVGALDFGASKVACLIGKAEGAGFSVVGVGRAKPQTGADGAPLDFEACVRAIRIAVDQAERMAGGTISSVITGFGGKGLSSRRVEAQISLPPGPISPRSVRALLSAAMDGKVDAGRTLLHAAPAGYRIDGGPLVPDPRGREGQILSVELTLVTAPEAAIAALTDCIAEAGLRVSRVVASPYAAALAVLSAEECLAGAVSLDCGAAHVGVAAFCAGALTLVESAPVGGAALTADIAARLGATFAAAERVKVVHGGFSAAPPAEIPVEAPHIGGDGRLEARIVSRGSIIEAMGPRLEEMLASVGARLAPLRERESDKPWRLAITGGGAQLSGLRDLAEHMLMRPARLARPIGFGVLDQGPQAHGFAVAAGLLRYDLDPPPEAGRAPEPAKPSCGAPKARALPSGARLGGAMGKAWSWLKENF